MIEDLRVTIEDTGVMHIELCRPDAKNALTIAMRDGLVNALADARTNPAVRAVLISGAGYALFGWINTNIMTLARIQETNARAEATLDTSAATIQQSFAKLAKLVAPWTKG